QARKMCSSEAGKVLRRQARWSHTSPTRKRGRPRLRVGLVWIFRAGVISPAYLSLSFGLSLSLSLAGSLSFGLSLSFAGSLSFTLSLSLGGSDLSLGLSAGLSLSLGGSGFFSTMSARVLPTAASTSAMSASLALFFFRASLRRTADRSNWAS